GERRGEVSTAKDCGRVWAVVFLGDQTVVASGNARPVAYDLGTGQVLREFNRRGGGDAITALAGSPDRATPAACSYDGNAWVWNARTGEELYTLNGGVGVLWAVACTPDGSHLLTGGGGVYIKSESRWLPGDRFTLRSWEIRRP